jgi:hypothetical protein
MIAFKIHSAKKNRCSGHSNAYRELEHAKVLTYLKRGKAEVLKKQVNNIIEMGLIS